MLPNEVLLTQQGPLARVWLAAHWERKLNKAQFLQTDIPASVETIVGEGEDDAPVALRLSGQLLLGIVRIYSRKAKYLEDDCNDALLRIQVAFRGANAVIDLSHDQQNLSRAAITLPDTLSVADLLMPEPAYAAPAAAAAAHARHSARPADITLPDSQLASMDVDIPSYEPDSLLGGALADLDTSTQFDLGIEDDAAATRPPTKRPREWRPRGSSSRRSAASDTHRAEAATADTSRADTSVGDASLAPTDADDSYASVGVGRDASVAPASAAEHVRSLLGDVDLSMDFSMDAIEMPTHTCTCPGADAATPPRPTEPPRAATPVPDVSLEEAIGARTEAPLTPRTAAKLRSAALARADAAPKGQRKRPLQDSVTDLGRSHMLQLRSAAATMTTSPHELRCLPASRTQLAMFLAPKDLARDTQRMMSMMWGAVYAEYAPSIAEAMRLDARKQHAAPHYDRQQWLRDVHDEAVRLNRDEDEFPHEVGRRASDAPWLTEDVRFADVSNATAASLGPDASVDKSLPPADFSMNDVPELPPLPAADTGRDAPPAAPAQPEPMQEDEPPALRRSSRRRAPSPTRTGHLPEVRLGTPEAEERAWHPTPVAEDAPLAAFETRAREQPRDASLAHWDASTLQAMHVLKSTMHDERTTFQTLAHSASRRAAAGFFFEMLVLGTKNCVRLEQEEPYGDVDIAAKPALYTSP
ncbi:sister chromatid cohesion protein 1 [Malassezia brasiliensis]|uniref:Sister chromatid cohesion protein 1 n=1 Tax=Malassezia brasiliensis TaxID=1821822 RepID=A0AAF0DSS4_9BASI|nr:sister chromatid cohesion protein 1 [Malassezia brasiliensis]